MEYVQSGSKIIARLNQGDSLIPSLILVCEALEAKTVIVLSALGQLKDVEIGYFKGKGDYSPTVLPGPLELLSMSGAITNDGKGYRHHLHSCLGGPDKEVLGGHLIKATVSLTAEVFLEVIDITIAREFNEATGTYDLSLRRSAPYPGSGL